MAKADAVQRCTLQEPTVWYFAYGSNMSSEKFTGGRGIVPIAAARATLPGWSMVMNIPGLPYSEPAFSSIEPATCAADLKMAEVVGVAYLVTSEQYTSIVASEGGGIAYADVEIDARPLHDEDQALTGPAFKVRTLQGIMTRDPEAHPSRRYMDIITTGAAESKLPLEYQEFLAQWPVYEPPESGRTHLGAMLFLALWSPVMRWLEQLTHATIRKDGNVPSWVAFVVRSTIGLIWLSHDLLFAPIFGRGDGIGKQPVTLV